ncbi:MAG: ABC transporter ATP-binding protein [Bacteroidota bacterium]
MLNLKNNIILELINLSKLYRTPASSALVVSNFNLTVSSQEFVSIIGHSGCGKTTVLSMIAGLIYPDSGSIELEGKDIKKPGPDRGLVFQSPNLLPWMTALENVYLGVNHVFSSLSKRQKKEQCMYYLDKVGMSKHYNKSSSELSQGMKQRVGIARAFAIKPKILLLDEPFGMLDSFTRMELQDVLLEIWTQEKITALMVTHDVDEAIYLSDKVVMMTKGPAASIGGVLKVDVERPRDRENLGSSSRCQDLRETILNFL